MTIARTPSPDHRAPEHGDDVRGMHEHGDDGCRGDAPDGSRCPFPVEAGAPVALCASHLFVAHDWVVRDVGVTDLLPAPCLACASRTGIRYPSGWICAVCEWRVGEVPDTGLVPDRIEVVYYIRFGERIKIGTSGNPRRRLATLVHDELLAFERGGRDVEQRRHRQFDDQRQLRTEWFTADDTLLAHVAELRAGVDDPWQQYARWVSAGLALRG